MNCWTAKKRLFHGDRFWWYEEVGKLALRRDGKNHPCLASCRTFPFPCTRWPSRRWRRWGHSKTRGGHSGLWLGLAEPLETNIIRAFKLRGHPLRNSHQISDEEEKWWWTEITRRKLRNSAHESESYFSHLQPVFTLSFSHPLAQHRVGWDKNTWQKYYTHKPGRGWNPRGDEVYLLFADLPSWAFTVPEKFWKAPFHTPAVSAQSTLSLCLHVMLVCNGRNMALILSGRPQIQLDGLIQVLHSSYILYHNVWSV